MRRTHRNILLGFLVGAMMSALPAIAQEPQSVDVTQRLVSGGAVIDQFRAVDVGGILILRGSTADASKAVEAGQIAQSLGYGRVANLIRISTPVDDATIERLAERELNTNRSLYGCHLTVDSQGGVVELRGEIDQELQKDVAVQLVRNIDGVRLVHADLHRF